MAVCCSMFLPIPMAPFHLLWWTCSQKWAIGWKLMGKLFTEHVHDNLKISFKIVEFSFCGRVRLLKFKYFNLFKQSFLKVNHTLYYMIQLWISSNYYRKQQLFHFSLLINYLSLNTTRTYSCYSTIYLMLINVYVYSTCVTNLVCYVLHEPELWHTKR